MASAAAVPIGTPTVAASSATCMLVINPRKNSGLSQALTYQCSVIAAGGKLMISCEKKLVMTIMETGAKTMIYAIAISIRMRPRPKDGDSAKRANDDADILCAVRFHGCLN